MDFCTCSLTEAGKALEAHCARLGQLVAADEVGAKAIKQLQSEWKQTQMSWKSLYHQHVTEYREALQLSLLNHSKAMQIHAPLAEPLATSVHTAAAIREARKPATRKKKRASKKQQQNSKRSKAKTD